MLKEKVENKPVRLHKKEPLALEYNEATVYSTGAIFITLIFGNIMGWICFIANIVDIIKIRRIIKKSKKAK